MLKIIELLASFLIRKSKRKNENEVQFNPKLVHSESQNDKLLKNIQFDKNTQFLQSSNFIQLPEIKTKVIEKQNEPIEITQNVNSNSELRYLFLQVQEYKSLINKKDQTLLKKELEIQKLKNEHQNQTFEQKIISKNIIENDHFENKTNEQTINVFLKEFIT